jgi:hypothetical protein
VILKLNRLINKNKKTAQVLFPCAVFLFPFIALNTPMACTSVAGFSRALARERKKNKNKPKALCSLGLE